jgi:hypothetical protein
MPPLQPGAQTGLQTCWVAQTSGQSDSCGEASVQPSQPFLLFCSRSPVILPGSTLSDLFSWQQLFRVGRPSPGCLAKAEVVMGQMQCPGPSLPP